MHVKDEETQLVRAISHSSLIPKPRLRLRCSNSLFVFGAQQSDLIICVHVFVHAKLLQSNSLYSMDCSLPGSSDHGDSPGKNTGVGCCAFLQGIFPTQGSNLSLRSLALAGGFFTTSASWEAPLGWQYTPKWSIDSVQYLMKYQLAFC